MENKNLIRFSKLVIHRNRVNLIFSFIFVCIISIIDLFLPQITRLIIDEGINNENITLLIKLIILYGLIKVLSSLFNLILSYLYSLMKNKVTISLKIKLLNHVSKLSGRYYSNMKTGNTLSIIENDIFVLKNFGAELIFSILENLITAIVAIFFLMKIRYDLFLVVLILQVSLALIQTKITKIISKDTKEVREESGIISNITQEYISNIMSIVITKSKLKFFISYLRKERNLARKFLRLDMIMAGNISASQILNGFVTMSVYGFGGYNIINKKMTIGELIAFQQYTSFLIGPCISIIRSINRIQQSKVSIDRVYSIIDEEIEIKVNNMGHIINLKNCNSIKLSNVYFKYYNDSDYVLDNISMEFRKGEITALVGGSGCGKSTIINLIYRLWDVTDGNIFIDNINIKDINLKSLRDNITIVTQDLLIFDDTIKNNIIINNNVSDDILNEICKIVGLNDYINTLDNGLDTIVGEKGTKISGGQKQRIALARALISNNNILILDEATSSLDNISQNAILNNISKYIKDKIVIIIAHRLSTIKSANNIYVLEKGTVIESGNNKELFEANGMYKKLVKAIN
ncbi:ABC transporter ATP-binding protein [Clostridioides difficile]|uniref:ABC transporter ATP-binding protein n=1 Tax=Clostridioides difficile TaxID=1496 RepID=UPI00093DF9FC|nr:ABC transporter ATP-binding protein [Clostridioides difficile]EGT3801613.1 ABC transporter ATP-binding protein [Clostridioides difficile]EKG0756267.1 ABC transporter ATP-binding protein [Clostridioides difficile]EKG0783977.1 ABC transporter ATP-binding protein [Clostridioides difficile]EKS6760773.1 ABC transporter ATP-binding protein [Clostridioides difficile]MBH6909235.1 ABC transporter ATP-binding protein [Clostridioides difficile]